MIKIEKSSMAILTTMEGARDSLSLLNKLPSEYLGKNQILAVNILYSSLTRLSIRLCHNCMSHF